MKLFTSYYANYEKIPKNYMCIGISRYCPEWLDGNGRPNFFFVKKNFLAPTEQTLFDFKEGKIAESEYTEQYVRSTLIGLQELGYPDIPSWIKALEKQFHQWDAVVFMCYETPDKFCHRHILRRMLKNHFQIPIDEYNWKEEYCYGYKKKKDSAELF